MAGQRGIFARIGMVAVPAALGVAAVFYAGRLKTLPEPVAANRPPALVRVITLAPTDLVPRISGYGTVAPVREWRAIARAEGEITAVAQPLAAGDIVAADTLLFRIDDTDLKLDLANVEAQVSASRVKDQTVEISLGLARKDLELAQQDLKRQERLNTQGVATQAELETSRRQALVAETKVTDLENQLKLNAAEREVLATQRGSLERAIAFAEIRAPYALRVTALDADLGQYVSRGQLLLEAEGVEAVDISAQFPIGRIGPLLRLAGEGATVTGLGARVKLPAADHAVVWKARVERVGDAIDATTQSAPVVVRVDDPQGQSVAGERPPLRRNMVVEVELFAPKRAALVVPAEAVAGGTALVVSEAGTLEPRKVETGFVSGDLAVVTKGLAAGDRLVVTDPSIAVPGMAVKPVEDETRKAEIAAEALGQSPGAAKPGSGMGSGAGSGKGGGAGKTPGAGQ
ncbi:efflux RND transporter periplasmic adaptor subunit [Sinirhodobacter ferrireducens]|uniref:Efflux RND transporter periplasmic adaptor subunit n=2 Tax=Paenirhodobacter ferrireducens TaxID=1215032 RepID=A0A443LUY8_9RHOB|nr:efflux RND transporter periplasmic adaptor subunit [Sinirhodobacter ferrireducens]